MKSIQTYVMLLAIVSFIGCKKQTDIDLSGSYTIKSGETLLLPKNRKGAMLTASEFTDSRCPSNAICVWEGVGTGKFKFNDNIGAQTLELCIGACAVVSKPKTQEIILNNITYKVELAALNPYPGESAKNATIKATLILTRK